MVTKQHAQNIYFMLRYFEMLQFGCQLTVYANDTTPDMRSST